MSRGRAARAPIADVASIPTRIRALEAELRALRRLAVDELVRAMVTTIAGRELAFNAIEVWNHARLLSPGLRCALEAAGMTSPRRLGKLLQQLQGRDVGGLRLERLGEDYLGAVWVFRVCPTHSGPPLPHG